MAAFVSRRFIAVTALLLLPVVEHQADAQTAKTTPAYSAMARVVLEHCVHCHHGGQPRGGLDLSRADGWRRGGDGGAVFVIGVPEESFLVQRIREGSMPPLSDGRALNGPEIDAIESWIREGALWPANIASVDEPKPNHPSANRRFGNYVRHRTIHRGGIIDERPAARETGSPSRLRAGSDRRYSGRFGGRRHARQGD